MRNDDVNNRGNFLSDYLVFEKPLARLKIKAETFLAGKEFPKEYADTYQLDCLFYVENKQEKGFKSFEEALEHLGREGELFKYELSKRNIDRYDRLRLDQMKIEVQRRHNSLSLPNGKVSEANAEQKNNNKLCVIM